jgi:hypothetical protein
VLELRDLDRALAKLPSDYRSVILMVGLEGMSYEMVGRDNRYSGGYGALAAVPRSEHVAQAHGHRTG